MIAYAKLCAEIEARQLPGDRPPKQIIVLRGSEEDLRTPWFDAIPYSPQRAN